MAEPDLSPGEIRRQLDTLERRQFNLVSKEIYERDIREIHSDIAEIKESQKWSGRLIIAQFVTLIIALIVIAVTRAVAIG
jgi:hypothetical protein